jgi:hypothetical protein
VSIEGRLRAALTRSGVALLASCAGLGAGEIAGRVAAAVLDGRRSEPRDDIALVVGRIAAFAPTG